MKGNTMATQGVLRMVTETNELIVNPVGDVIHFRGKVGLQDQVEILYASSPMALNTLTYVAQYFTEVRNNGTLKIFKRTEPNTPHTAPGADADGRILDAAQSLIGHHSIVTVVRNEAERLNNLGYTATSRRMYEAAHKLDKLFEAIETDWQLKESTDG